MRYRRVLLSVAAFALLATAGCSSGTSDEAGTPPPVAPGPSSAAAVPATSGAVQDPAGQPTSVPPAEAQPTGGASVKPGRGTATARPGGAFAPGAQLSAAGLGPYQVAAPRAGLQEAGLLTSVDTSAGCPDFVVAKGLPGYQTPGLVFYQGKLQYASVTSSKTATTKGAKVGMKLADVKKKYPKGKQLDDWNGAVAWFAAEGRNALMFRFKSNKVESIEAGVADPLQFRFTDGEGC
jgi:hypothetical protein